MSLNHNKSTLQILIIGGGVAGIELATKLGKCLGKKNKALITLVDLKFTHIWKPLLHEVAAGTLNAGSDEVNYIVQGSRSGFNFIQGKLIDVDRIQKIATFSKGNSSCESYTIAYDYLVIAIGSQANDFSTPGVRENALFLDSREQAENIRHRFLDLCTSQQNKKTTDKVPLTVSIIGAGATGVELAAELRHACQLLIHYGFHQYKQIPVKINLLEGADRVLPVLPEKISASITKLLAKQNITVLTKTQVVNVEKTGITTKQKGFIASDMVIWTAGVIAPDILGKLKGIQSNKSNKLVIKETLQSISDDRIFAIGDCAHLELNYKNKTLTVPPRAQAAHQQASFLAKTLSQHILAGKSFKPFIYKDHGSLVSLSKRSTIGFLMGNLMGRWPLSGFLARIFYLSLYRSHQFAVHGFRRTTMMIIRDALDSSTQAKIKLH